MKVTVEIPDTTVVFTYQYVFENDKQGHLSILQDVIDSHALDKLREVANNDPHT